MILVLVPVPDSLNIVVRTVIQQAKSAGEEFMVTTVPALSLSYENTGRIRIYHDGRGAVEPDVIFYWLRSVSSTLESLDLGGHRLINPISAWRIGRDKALQLALFEKNGIPHPWTLFTCSGWPAADAHVGWPGHELVLKPHDGGRGRSVQKARDRRAAARLVSRTSRYRGGVLIQEYLDHAPKSRHHWRVNVVGGEPVTGVRLDSGGDWITNQARGGRAHRFEDMSDLPREAVELALRAVAAVGADYSGVDVIEGSDGLFRVLETNELPGFGESTAQHLGKHIVDIARSNR